jgi:hypothetical protein
MTQFTYDAAPGGSYINCSGLAAGNSAVLRGKAGNDTLIGSDGNDRFSLGEGNDSVFGGAGDDYFFVGLSGAVPTGRDTIDGGIGNDELNITLSRAQLTDAVRAELAKLSGFLISAPNEPGTRFVSDLLHLDMTGVERLSVRVDGVNQTVDSLVSQITATGTAGNDLLNGSMHTANLVLRGQGGHDTMLGGSGNDRFDGGAGADSMSGSAGNDMFFISRDNTIGGARDTIDGGTGSDELIITANSSQMTDTFKAELLRLNNFTILHGSDSTAHFISDILHLDMSGVETARVRLDGVMTSLDAVAPRIVNGNFNAPVAFAGWHPQAQTDMRYDSYVYSATVERYGLDGVATFSFEGLLNTTYGATVNGPSIISDAFAARAGETISFGWDLDARADTGILRVALIDAVTGAAVQPLFSATVDIGNYDGSGFHGGDVQGGPITTTGLYKLAVELDSFDSTFGGVIGAYATLDNVVIG